MSARFRIRTAQGQELSFGSEEMFADFVRSGELSPDDLVYDARTGEWCSALTHSLVVEWHAERQAAEDAGPGAPDGAAENRGAPPGRTDASAPAETPPPGPASEGGRGGGAGKDGGGTMDFELSPARTPEEEAAAFVEEMNAERESEFDRVEAMRGLDVDDGSMNLLTEVPGDTGRTRPPRTHAPRGGVEGDVRAAPQPDPAGARAPSRSRVSRRFLVWALAFGLVGAGVLLGSDIAAVVLGISGSESLDAAGRPLVLPDTEEALRERATTRFLAQARGELGELPAIPSIWLDGRYLAGASGYPEVRRTWTAYRNAIEEVRSGEAQMYRRAYLSALDDARVSGATRTLRLASAASSFEAAGRVRATHYDRVAELAAGAIDLHDLLVEHEGAITYEPAVGPRVSVDPVLQAAAADPAVQRALEGALDRVLDALSAGGTGPVDARAVPPWPFQGLRDIMDPE